MDEKQARSWAALCHLSALAMFIGVPFGNVFGPLIFWLIKKNESPFIDDQGKEALNFQLSVTLYVIISVVLIFVLIGIVLLVIIGIVNIILIIIAAVKASNGETYRYPLNIRFIR